VVPLNTDPDSIVYVLNEMPLRYSYFKSVPLKQYGGRVALEDDSTRYPEDQPPKAALDTTTPKEAELKQKKKKKKKTRPRPGAMKLDPRHCGAQWWQILEKVPPSPRIKSASHSSGMLCLYALYQAVVNGHEAVGS
jgi:hypothetical protein